MTRKMPKEHHFTVHYETRKHSVSKSDWKTVNIAADDIEELDKEVDRFAAEKYGAILRRNVTITEDEKVLYQFLSAKYCRHITVEL